MFMNSILQTKSPAVTVLIRLLVGAVFLSEGIQKFLLPDQLGAGRFLRIGIPAPEVMGPFVGVVEIVGGALVILGLFTRPAALLLLINISVAILSTKVPILLAHGFWTFSLPKLAHYGFWSMAHEARTDFSMWLGSLFLVIGGGGRLSFDAHEFRLHLAEKAGISETPREWRKGLNLGQLRRSGLAVFANYARIRFGRFWGQVVIWVTPEDSSKIARKPFEVGTYGRRMGPAGTAATSYLGRGITAGSEHANGVPGRQGYGGLSIWLKLCWRRRCFADDHRGPIFATLGGREAKTHLFGETGHCSSSVREGGAFLVWEPLVNLQCFAQFVPRCGQPDLPLPVVAALLGLVRHSQGFL